MLTVSQPLDASLPAEAGIYGWWFSDRAVAELAQRLDDNGKGDLLDANRCQESGYSLLYIGKAQRQSIAQRVHKRHLHRLSVSTLRVSLAVLRRLPRTARDRLASPEWESELTHWMREHCRLSWRTAVDAGAAERDALSSAYTPLNLKSCPVTPFRRRLSSLRKF